MVVSRVIFGRCYIVEQRLIKLKTFILVNKIEDEADEKREKFVTNFLIEI